MLLQVFEVETLGAVPVGRQAAGRHLEDTGAHLADERLPASCLRVLLLHPGQFWYGVGGSEGVVLNATPAFSRPRRSFSSELPLFLLPVVITRLRVGVRATSRSPDCSSV